MEKIFTLFGQVEGDCQDKLANPDGLGLGLNICHNIVKKNGGYIEVHSNGENQGSTFMFGMKMEDASASRPEKSRL